MLRLAILTLLAVSFSSCAGPLTQPARPFPFTELGSQAGLDAQPPTDVLVRPVHDQSGTERVPTESLQKTLTVGLVDRLYSPVAGSPAEGSAMEAAMPTGIDAILQVVVTRWDETHLVGAGRIEIEAEARLLDGRNAGRALLWGVSLGRPIEIPSRIRQQLTTAEVRARAAGDFAKEVLALIPERDPLATR